MTGEQLRQARAKLGMTQKELGEALEMAKNHIAMMERNETMIRKVTELAVTALLIMSKKRKGKRGR
jgi:transcriptional regulator with XRE-family HTH domain